ncbi:hypothetical protein PC121_g4707 [Phytophthora cactorum]|nr:hypothetical protein PC121_g4707 [Phytophthora cactorum]
MTLSGVGVGLEAAVVALVTTAGSVVGVGVNSSTQLKKRR